MLTSNLIKREKLAYNRLTLISLDRAISFISFESLRWSRIGAINVVTWISWNIFITAVACN